MTGQEKEAGEPRLFLCKKTQIFSKKMKNYKMHELQTTNTYTKTDGIFEMHENGELITDVYAKLVKNGEPRICKCCGRTVTSYFETEYYDEHDDGHFGTYGTECFKKIATFDASVFGI